MPRGLNNIKAGPTKVFFCHLMSNTLPTNNATINHFKANLKCKIYRIFLHHLLSYLMMMIVINRQGSKKSINKSMKTDCYAFDGIKNALYVVGFGRKKNVNKCLNVCVYYVAVYNITA